MRTKTGIKDNSTVGAYGLKTSGGAVFARKMSLGHIRYEITQGKHQECSWIYKSGV
jgi:hypothetical protein